MNIKNSKKNQNPHVVEQQPTVAQYASSEELTRGQRLAD